MVLTEEQLVLRGETAARYLSDEVLMGFVAEMQQDILTCIGNTQPDDNRTRNTLYFEHRGLNDLLAHLKQYRETAKKITERNNAHTQLDTD